MAVSLSINELATAIKGTTAVATRLLPVVTLMIERYAVDAPPSIQNEAAIRCAGWLADQMPNLNVKAGNLTLRKTTRFKGDISALRASGAMALLSPYRLRRGSVA